MSAVLAAAMSPMGQTVIQLAAYYAQKALDANTLLAKSQAEGRDPTAAEVQALHDQDDGMRALLQANIDRHTDAHFGKPTPGA